MPIVPSRSGPIHELVARLASSRAGERDGAVARLTLLGARALGPLTASLPAAATPARLASIEVLGEVADPRARRALEGLAGDPDSAVAARAVEALGERGEAASVPALAGAMGRPRAAVRRAALGALAKLHQRGVVEALAPLLDTLLDEGADPRLRAEVADLLPILDPPLGRADRQKLARRLGASSAPAVAARATSLAAPGERGGARGHDPLDRLGATRVTIRDAADAAAALRETLVPLARLHQALQSARAPEAVAVLAARLGERGDPTSIPVLARSLDGLGGSGRATDPAVLDARVAVHAALADLDSRIALHDLRDLVARHPRQVMTAALAVVARVGDGSLVPALARAATEDPSLAEACAQAFAALARRHRLRRTSPALRRVRLEHRAALEGLLGARRRR